MNRPWARLMKFGIVGMMNTAFDLAVFALLTAAGLAATPSQIISYGCGTVSSYWGNRNWTFRDHRRESGGKAALRFLLLNLTALTAASLLLEGLHSGTGLPLAVCKLSATAAGAVINYLGSRLWVFGSADQTRSESI